MLMTASSITAALARNLEQDVLWRNPAQNMPGVLAKTGNTCGKIWPLPKMFVSLHLHWQYRRRRYYFF